MNDNTEQTNAPEATAPVERHPVSSMRDEMDRALEHFFSNDWMRGFSRLGRMWEDTGFPEFGRGLRSSVLAMPKADLSEDDKQYELSVELPGMTEKDLELTFSEGALLLKGEKKEEKETKEKDYHITERSYGSVRRRFPLPPGVNAEKMDAKFANGVLKVVLPKTKEAKKTARKIKVKGG